MSSILLYHHLGLGDHFMCHGIVREYCKKYGTVGLFCYPHNYPTVSFMYRDIPNLTIIQGDDTAAKKLLEQDSSYIYGVIYDEVKVLGFQYLDRTSGVPLEWQFYQLAGVPIEKKWGSFFIDRDLEREQLLFEKITPQGNYAFVHDDAPRKYVIRRDLIGQDCTIVIPKREFTDNIIDFCTTIEKAKEVHVIDSSFMFLIDCLPYHNPNQKLYIHRYARDNNEWQLPILKKDWHIFVQPHNKWEPVKDLLQWAANSSTPFLNSTFAKRVVRKIFITMGWSMMRPKHPDIKALIQRYVPGKSFTAISIGSENNAYVSAAHATRATTAGSSTIEKATPADIVFCSRAFSQKNDQHTFLKQLRSITNDTLILHTTMTDTAIIEPPLEDTGFSIREQHLFPKESVFVCKAMPTPKTK